MKNVVCICMYFSYFIILAQCRCRRHCLWGCLGWLNCGMCVCVFFIYFFMPKWEQLHPYLHAHTYEHIFVMMLPMLQLMMYIDVWSQRYYNCNKIFFVNVWLNTAIAHLVALGCCALRILKIFESQHLPHTNKHLFKL